MKRREIFAGLLLVGSCFSTPALADVAGRYETVDENAVIDMEMTIEADDTGRVRFQMAGMTGYYLLNGEELFIVEKDGESFVVTRTADLFVLQQEAMDRLGWKGPKGLEKIEPPSLQFAPMKEETVGGRKGIGYGIIPENGAEPMYASIAIARDSNLAPLGQAIAFVQDASIKGMGSMGSMLGMMNAQMIDLLQAGAPLRMLNIELTDVSFDKIPEARLALPTEPLTLDQLRARVAEPVEPPPTLPAREDQ